MYYISYYWEKEDQWSSSITASSFHVTEVTTLRDK